VGIAPESHVREEDGWVWLEADPRSLRRRGVAALFPLTAALVLAVALTDRLPPAAVVLVVLAMLAAGGPVAVRAWARASSRVGAASAGLMVQGGVRSEAVAWDAVQAVEWGPGRRSPVAVRLADRTIASAGTFTAAAADDWARAASRVAPPHVGWPARS
jgi:hypothetical protein